MKSLSPITVADLRDLLRSESLWERIVGRHAHLLGLMERICRRGELNAIPYLALLITDRRTRLGNAALRTIDAMLRTCTPTAVIRIIIESRELDPAIIGRHLWQRWQRISPEQLERWRTRGKPADALFAVLSGHHNGYIRERAVDLLAGSQAPYFIPTLRLRLNDWVEKIRFAAVRVITPYLHSASPETLLTFMPVLENLRHCGRGKHDTLLHSLHARMTSPQTRQTLLDGCTHTDKTVRWWCFVTLAASEQTIPFRRDILVRGDLAMRRHVAKTIADQAQEVDPSPYCDLMLADPYMPVRRDGLLALVAWSGEAAIEHVRRLSCDRNATVRECARYYLAKWSAAAGIAALYRRRMAIAADAELAGCIAGLGEIGEAGDAMLLAPFLGHRRVALRRAAIRALNRLLPEAALVPFLAALRDSSQHIRRAAIAALGRRWDRLSPDLLLERFSSGASQEQAAIIAVISHVSALDALGTYLGILTHRGNGWQMLAADRIRMICSTTIQGYIAMDPNSPTLGRITRFLPHVDSSIATLVLSHLRAILGNPNWPVA